MDQSTFTKLTGRTISASQSDNFAGSVETAKQVLEDLLGWPLDPDCWDDQYLERGKTQSESVCIDDDVELDDPDDVQGSTRIYSWDPDDWFLSIDPVTRIHSVKLVSDDVTYKTFELGEYQPRWINGRDRYAKYIEIKHDCPWYSRHAGCCCLQIRQIAIDADWAFDPLPKVIQRVWADLVWDDLNPKRDLRSQTLGPHSYTFANNGSAVDRHTSVLSKFAGPNGNIAKGITIV